MIKINSNQASIYIMTLKKKIISLTLFGLVPFYSDLAFIFFEINIKSNFFPTSFSAIYGALIICFLSGMHWKSFIEEKKIEFLVLPLIPVIFLWTTFFFSHKFFFQFTIIFGLLWCLITDLILLKKLNKKWFNKMRVFVTILAIIPLALNFFYQ